MPSIAIFDDRVRVSIPNFMTGVQGESVPLPFSHQICGFLPKFVWHGSFATAFLTTIQTINDEPHNVNLLSNACKPILRQQFTQLFTRVRLASPMMNEDTDKFSEPFPFAFVSHLIETSNNSFNAQHYGFAWL